VNVKIVAGPFAVHVNKKAAEFVHVTQHGEQLTVALDYPKEWKWLGPQEALAISCPRLTALSTEGTYTVAGKPQASKLQAGAEVEISGFRQDSLMLQQARSSQVHLVGNTLGWLRALAGTHAGSEPELSIDADNHIQAADLTVGHRGHLVLATAIPRLRYQLSDSVSVVLNGAAARSLSTAK
jgi:hypothetical protein